MRKAKKSPAKKIKSSRKAHDSAYKRLFSHTELVADLIRGYVDPRMARGWDLSTLERCNGSYISPDLRERRNDVVWRLRTRTGTRTSWTYVYLLLEFQSTVDRFMAVRLLGYLALLWQDLIAQQQLNEEQLLPAVLPIVLYNGDQTWNAPLHLRELIQPHHPLLAPLQPSFSYHFLDENTAPTEAGMKLRNLASAIFALEQTPGLAGQRKVIAALRHWLKSRHDLREAFGTWYAEALAPTGLLCPADTAKLTIDEVEPMMATRIMQDIKRQITEGEARGETRGEARGEARGMVEAIRQLVRSGVLSVDNARAQIKALVKAKKIPAKLAQDTFARLG
jgi:predicted transposase/invertase (TIGR01784 family)